MKTITTIFKDCNLYCDLENGFVYAGKNENENLFQCCLLARKDGKGFKKAIKKSDSGYNDGICGDYNYKLHQEDIDIVYEDFIKFAKSRSLVIV